MVDIRDENDIASGKFGRQSTQSCGGHTPPIMHHHKSKDSPLTTLEEHRNERSNMTHMTHSVSTILNTVENI